MKRTAYLTSLVLFLLATSSVRAGDLDGDSLAYLVSATAQLGVVGNVGLPVQYSESNLVANRAGLEASQIDPQLINAWGVTSYRLETERQESFEGSAQNSLFCVADAGAGVVTIYTRSGLKIPLEVTIPAAPGLPPGTLGSPAGIVFNSTSEFVISKNGKSGPALLLIAALDGTISGWNPDVDATNAVPMVDYSANKPNRPFPAVYQGLAIGRDGHQRNVLYGVDGGGTLETSNNEIDMFDGSFQPIGHFTDLNIPPGMTVYNLQNVEGRLYATFATFTLFGGGVIDVFDTDGNLLTPAHFATNPPGGPLESPWGVALAPDDFGPFSNAILIGNVDDSHISAFDRHTNQFLGQLTHANGMPLIGCDGLWGLLFDVRDGEKPQLFFAAGPNNYADGLFGVISPLEDEGLEK